MHAERKHSIMGLMHFCILSVFQCVSGFCVMHVCSILYYIIFTQSFIVRQSDFEVIPDIFVFFSQVVQNLQYPM